ncbi:MAG: hypothetical protein L3K17_09575 [Thermoplasmata archaeon]|nr:hypothetical protein [Thermoplasmata archaeon]
MIPRTVANRFADGMGVDLRIAQQEVVLLYCLNALAVPATLERLIGRARRTDWNREAAEAARRFAFLRELTPCELELIEDVRRHPLGPRPLDRLGSYH